MIVSTERFLKRLDISKEIDILEKLEIYLDYFKGKSNVKVITTDIIVFSGPNIRYDIISQLRMDLVNYFIRQKTTGIFGSLDELLNNVLKGTDGSGDIELVIENIEFDIKKGYHNHHYEG